MKPLPKYFAYLCVYALSLFPKLTYAQYDVSPEPNGIREGKLCLYFNGHNNYIEDAQIISDWSEITMMAWVKLDGTGYGIRTLFGQDNFQLQINSNNTLGITGSNKNFNTSMPLPTNQWVHIGVTFSHSDQTLKLFVNGAVALNTTNSGPLHTDTSRFTIGKQSIGGQFFKGQMDEVRLFNKALSTNEFQKMVYQEIEQNGVNVRGTEIPRDITDVINDNTITSLAWSHLVRYYKFDYFEGDITRNLGLSNASTEAHARLFNFNDVEEQSAPLPFLTQSSGDLVSSLSVATKGVNGNDAITYDWSIVKVQHSNVTFNNRQKHLGLIINEEDALSNPIKYQVTNDSELNVSWYLKLDGFIDLEGESQLVQGEDSVLDTSSIGKIERDQQGTADAFTYNYWSSPVTIQNSSLTSFKVTDVMLDGSNTEHPAPINFMSSGYNGTSSSPIGIADYWIWKFANQPNNNYSSWQHIRRTGSILPGEGFTMKGPGTGTILDSQNYVFRGKPNNGNINLTIHSNNDYLVGNPYPSALDANKFIEDNGLNYSSNDSSDVPSEPLLSGTLYFWKHWGGGSHILSEYKGGYATYNYSGAVAAASYGSDNPLIGTGGIETEKPGRYIPVGQGFFVVGKSTGTINFNNGQRVFKKESESNSVFLRSNNTYTSQDAIEADERMKFRIAFNSVNTIRRQLLLTIDENATSAVDWAYDAKNIESQIDDMFWMIDDEKYIIQASDEVEISTVYPIGIKSSSDGIHSITIDALEYVPEDIDIYVHDMDLNTYHNLRNEDFEFYLNAGEYLDRFAITFGNPEQLSLDDQRQVNIQLLYSNDKDKIVLINPNRIGVRHIELFNVLGQSVYNIKDISEQNYSEYDVRNLTTGTYIIRLTTLSGLVVTEKVLVQ